MTIVDIAAAQTAESAPVPRLALLFPDEVNQAFGGRLSRTKLYELVKEGRLETFVVDRKRFATIEAIQEFMAASAAGL